MSTGFERWPLIGRTKERATISRAIADAHRRPVVIRGAGGIGKTRLAREVGKAFNGTVFWVRGTLSGRHIPLGAFAAWVDPTVTDPLRRVNTLIETMTSDRSTLVVVDDLPRLDDMSLFVVMTLMHAGHVAVIATVRSDDPLTPTSAEVVDHENAMLIELPGLTETETADYVFAGLGAPASDELLASLFHRTRGNPLFLRALLEHSRDTGDLTLSDGVWISAGRPSLPDSLSAMLANRCESAGADVIDVIDVLAVAEPLPVPVVAELTGYGAIERAERHGFVATGGTAVHPELRLTHPILGEIRRASASVRHSRLRGQIARALAAAPGTSSMSGIKQAVLALDAEDFDGRDQILVAGAHAALGSTDLALALQLCAAVRSPDRSVQSQLISGYALSLLGQGDAAEATLAAVTGQAATPEEIELIALVRANNHVWTRDRPDEARSVADNENLRPRTAATISGILDALSGRPCAVLNALDGPAFSGVPPLGEVLRCWAMVIATGETGRVHDLTAWAAAGYAATDTPTTAHHRSALTHLHAYFCCLLGDPGTAGRAVADLADIIGFAPGLPRVWLTGADGMLGVACGNISLATRLLDTALRGFDELGAPPFMWIPFCLKRAEAAAMAGDRATLDTLITHLADHAHGAFGFLRPRIDLLKAWSLAWQGAVTAAIAVALRIADDARTAERVGHEILALQFAVRFGATTCVARAELLAESFPDLPRAVATAAHARAVGDAQKLDQVAELYTGFDLHTCAADAHAAAAIAHGDQGRNGARLTALENLARTADPRGIATPMMTAARLSDGLSARQREIVILARAGASNKGIADKLQLSVRTVEGHLYRAARVLGEPVRTGRRH